MAYTGVLRKYSYEIIDVVRESVKTLYNAEKQS